MSRLPRIRRALVASGLVAGAAGLFAAVALAVDAPSASVSPSSPDNQAPTFSWSNDPANDEAGFAWDLSGPSPESGGEGQGITEHTFNGLADGLYSFKVSELDPDGNPGPSSDGVSFLLDRADPDIAVSTSPSDPTGNNGWFRTSGVVVNFNCSDALSGLASASCAPFLVTNNNATTPVPARTATDNAGNSASSAPSVKVDIFEPTISSTTNPVAPPAGANGWFRTQPVVVDFSCAGGASGMVAASCTDASVSAEGETTVTRTAEDNAGNTRAGSRVVAIDTVDPDEFTALAPAAGATTNKQKPTFEWEETGDATSGLARFEVEIDGAPAGSVQAGAGPTESFTPTSNLSVGNHTWQIIAVDRAGNTRVSGPARSFTVDLSAPDEPTITGGPQPNAGTSDSTPTFTWATLPSATYSWLVKRDTTTVAGPATATSTVTLPTLADETYTFELTVTASNGEKATRVVRFSVDTVAPGAPDVNKSPAGETNNPSPVFGWGSVEGGATFSWQVLAPGNKIIQGPISTPATETVVGPLSVGSYAFQVRQIDAAGNIGPFSAAEPFSVVAGGGAVPAPPGGGGVVTGGSGIPNAGGGTEPRTQNVKALSPKKGTKITTLRPRVTWKKVVGATVYNVQFFRVKGTKLIKVHSAFPTRTTYRVPPKRLKAGWRVVWRVWPYMAARKDYSKQPLGVSFFDIRSNARR